MTGERHVREPPRSAGPRFRPIAADEADPPAQESAPPSEPGGRRRRRTRLFVPLLGSVVAIAILFIGVFPTRALLAQRSDIAATEATLAHLESRNAELTARVEALGTDAEIERIAREQYHLVYPGEEAYALLPAPPPTIPVPDAWPFRILRDTMAAGDRPSP